MVMYMYMYNVYSIPLQYIVQQYCTVQFIGDGWIEALELPLLLILQINNTPVHNDMKGCCYRYSRMTSLINK